MLLVTQGTKKVNQLGYDKKTGEYVYLHLGQEIWREKGTRELLEFFTEHRNELYMFAYYDLLDRFPTLKRYNQSCDKYGY